MKRQSIATERGDVSFPEYTNERIYMRPFRIDIGLPDDLKRWQPTVDAMLDGITTDRTCFLMIDQSPTFAGRTHRRGGVHIEGYWNGEALCHGDTLPPRHAPKPIWAPKPTWRSGGSSWSESDYSEPEGTLLAASVAACRCYVGEWEGPIGDGGDCSGVDVSSLRTIDCQHGRCYAGNVTMLHESIPVQRDGVRTLVRITVPGWTP